VQETTTDLEEVIIGTEIIDGIEYVDGISQAEVITDFDIEGVRVVEMPTISVINVINLV